MSKFADAMMEAIEHTTRGPKAAWLMGRACYLYTRSHDGAVINEEGDTISFGRWYSFCAAVNCGWRYLW
jgi:hypothetical protein